MDNGKWASVFGQLSSMLNAVRRHVREAVWTGSDTCGSDLQPAVFGDINSLSVREVDLHFVTEREREREGERGRERERFSTEEGLSHGKTHA